VLANLIKHGIGVWREQQALHFEFYVGTVTTADIHHMVHAPQALYDFLADGKCYFPCSFMQQFNLQETQIEQNTTSNLIQGFELPAEINMDAGTLQTLLDSLVQKHSVLRTGHRQADGNWVQVVHDRLSKPFVDIPVSGSDQFEALSSNGVNENANGEVSQNKHPEAGLQQDFDSFLEDFYAELQQQPWQCDDQPMYQVYRVHNAHRTALVWHTHHFHVDAFSLHNIQFELFQLCQASGLTHSSQKANTTSKRCEYVHFALSQFDPQHSESTRYWLEKYSGKQLNVPLQDQRHEHIGAADAAAYVEYPIRDEVFNPLSQYSKRVGASFTQIITSALAIVLHKLTGMEQVPLQMINSLRDRHQFDGIIGDFSSSLPVMLSVDPQGGFQAVFESYIRELSLLQKHRRFNLFALRNALSGHDTGVNSFGNIIVDSIDKSGFTDTSGFTDQLLMVNRNDLTTSMDLLVFINKDQQQCALSCLFKKSLFSDEVIGLLMQELENLLEVIATQTVTQLNSQLNSQPDLPIGDYQLNPELVSRLGVQRFSEKQLPEQPLPEQEDAQPDMQERA